MKLPIVRSLRLPAKSLLSMSLIMAFAPGFAATSTIGQGRVVNDFSASVGTALGSNDSVHVTGPGSQWKITSALNIGNRGNGTLTIDKAGVVNSYTSDIGSTAGSIVTVTGAGSQWNTATNLNLGTRGGQAGTLNILDSGSVSTQALSIGSSSLVKLDGGTLQLASGSVANGGVFNWVKGALGFTGDAAIGKDLLTSTTTLDSGMTLKVANTLTIGNGTSLLTNGGILRAATLALDGGTLQTQSSFTAGGMFNWIKGTLGFTGNASLGTGLLDKATTIDNGMTLRVADTLSIGTGTSMLIKGGSVTAGTLTLNGGSVQTSSNFTPGGVFNWIKGTLGFTGNASLGTGLLDSHTTLSAGKTLTVAKELSINAGNSLSVNGGTVNAATLTLNGGSLQTSSNFTPGGVFNWIKGTLNLTGNASIGTDLLTSNTTLAADKTLTVAKDLSITAGNSLTVSGGTVSAATLTLNGGSLKSSSTFTAGGIFNWIKGTLNLTGDAAIGTGLLGSTTTLDTGKTLTVENKLSIDKGNTLAIRGGTLNAETLSLNGGKLQTSGSFTTDSTFKWTQGTLDLSGDASLGSGLLKSTTTLGVGQSLAVQNALTVNSDNRLELNGGQLAEKTLMLTGGTVASSGAIDLHHAGSVVGYGSVLGTISGGADNTISASGGAMVLGNAKAAGGYAFGGTLKVGSQDVQLLSKDQAQLGLLTQLGNGGTLRSINGINLAQDSALHSSGNSSIQGAFTNNGSVSATGGTLSFMNDVNGIGSYAGKIAFGAGLSTGSSPTALQFTQGNVSFLNGSTLTLQLWGNAPGTEYGQLLDINTLSFHGKLDLVFGSGFIPLPGSSFALFGFDNFQGSFGSAKNGYDEIIVTGIDRNLLDFSHLATDGRLSMTVSAVPEPESWALMLAGLTLVASATQRRRKAAEGAQNQA